MGFNSRVFTITNAGFVLFARAQTGGTIRYTRFALGDGDIGNASASTLTALLSERASAPVESANVSGSRCTLSTKLLIAQVTTSFLWRELGIFAQDGDAEILYAYASTSSPELIDPAGGTQDKIISAQMEIGAAQVVIEIAPSAMLVSFDDLEREIGPQALLNKLIQVDGPDSGLDADTLDGKHATGFATADQGTKADNALPATGNAASASKLQTARKIGIGGKATAAGVAFDGSQDITINVTDVNATMLNGKEASHYAPASELALKADKTVQLTATVPAAWQGSAEPYTIEVTVPGLVVGAKCRAGLSASATAEQREAARNAVITPLDVTTADKLQLIADGDKPGVELPIIVTVWG